MNAPLINKLFRVLFPAFLVLTPAFATEEAAEETKQEQDAATVKLQTGLCLDVEKIRALWGEDATEDKAFYNVANQQTLDLGFSNCSLGKGIKLDYTADIKRLIVGCAEVSNYFDIKNVLTTTKEVKDQPGVPTILDALKNFAGFELVSCFLKEVQVSQDFDKHAWSVTLTTEPTEEEDLTEAIAGFFKGANKGTEGYRDMATFDENKLAQKVKDALQDPQLKHTLKSKVTLKYGYKDLGGVKLALTGMQSKVFEFPALSAFTVGGIYKGPLLSSCDMGLDVTGTYKDKNKTGQKSWGFEDVDITLAKRANQLRMLVEEATLTYAHSDSSFESIPKFVGSLGLKVKFVEFQLNQFAFFRKNLSGWRQVLDYTHQISFGMKPMKNDVRAINIEWEVGFTKRFKGSMFFSKKGDQLNGGMEFKYEL